MDAVFALSASLIDPMSTFTSGPERRLLRESNTSEIGGKAEVPGTCSIRCFFPKGDILFCDRQRRRGKTTFPVERENRLESAASIFSASSSANKWLFDDFIVTEFLQSGLVDVSGNEQYWDRRAFLLDLARELHTIHAGHGKIEQHQIDFGVPFKKVERGAAAAYRQHDIAETFQH